MMGGVPATETSVFRNSIYNGQHQNNNIICNHYHVRYRSIHNPFFFLGRTTHAAEPVYMITEAAAFPEIQSEYNIYKIRLKHGTYLNGKLRNFLVDDPLLDDYC